MTGNKSGKQLSLASRRELIAAISERYNSASRAEKEKILDELVEVNRFEPIRRKSSHGVESGRDSPDSSQTSAGPRSWRTREDPFESTWPMIENWLNKTARRQREGSSPSPSGGGPAVPMNLLRTLQRRVREWRTAIARRLALGTAGISTEVEKKVGIF